MCFLNASTTVLKIAISGLHPFAFILFIIHIHMSNLSEYAQKSISLLKSDSVKYSVKSTGCGGKVG